MNRSQYVKLADAIRRHTVSVEDGGVKRTHIDSGLVTDLVFDLSGDREFDPYSFVARCNQEQPL